MNRVRNNLGVQRKFSRGDGHHGGWAAKRRQKMLNKEQKKVDNLSRNRDQWRKTENRKTRSPP